jgi:RNA polymerase sigma-70 factor (ECF subfamily)
VQAVVVDEWRDRLARLSPRQRDAIVLRHVVGLSYEEIGDVLDRPPGTVKSDVHRGLARLREILASEGTQ